MCDLFELEENYATARLETPIDPIPPKVQCCPTCNGTGRVHDPAAGETPAVPGFPDHFQTPEFIAAWADWEAHRRQKKNRLTPKARERQVEMLTSIGLTRAIACIDHSIRNGWTGLFESRENTNISKLYDPLKACAARAAEDGSLDREHGT